MINLCQPQILPTRHQLISLQLNCESILFSIKYFCFIVISSIFSLYQLNNTSQKILSHFRNIPYQKNNEIPIHCLKYKSLHKSIKYLVPSIYSVALAPKYESHPQI